MSIPKLKPQEALLLLFALGAGAWFFRGEQRNVPLPWEMEEAPVATPTSRVDETELQKLLASKPGVALNKLRDAGDPRASVYRFLHQGQQAALVRPDPSPYTAALQSYSGSPQGRVQLKFLEAQARLWSGDPGVDVGPVGLSKSGQSLPLGWLYLLGDKQPLPFREEGDTEAALILYSQMLSELKGTLSVSLPDVLPDTPVGRFVRKELEYREKLMSDHALDLREQYLPLLAERYRQRGQSVAWRYLLKSGGKNLTLSDRLNWLELLGPDETSQVVDRCSAMLVDGAPVGQRPALQRVLLTRREKFLSARRVAVPPQFSKLPAVARANRDIALVLGDWNAAARESATLNSPSAADQVRWAVALDLNDQAAQARPHYQTALPDLKADYKELVKLRLAGSPVPTLVQWVEVGATDQRFVIVGEGVPDHLLPQIPVWRHRDAEWDIRSSPNVETAIGAPYFEYADTRSNFLSIRFKENRPPYRFWVESRSPRSTQFPNRLTDMGKTVFNEHIVFVMNEEHLRSPQLEPLREQGLRPGRMGEIPYIDYARFRFQPPYRRLEMTYMFNHNAKPGNAPSPEEILAHFRPKPTGSFPAPDQAEAMP